MIVVWGFKDGICLPLSGKGFRREFSNGADAEMFIKYQCKLISAKDVDRYAMYITEESLDMDQMLRHHHFAGTQYSMREDNKRIENIDILKIKELVDLEYQIQLRRQAVGKMKIDHEIRSMNSEQLRMQAELFNKFNSIGK